MGAGSFKADMSNTIKNSFKEDNDTVGGAAKAGFCVVFCIPSMVFPSLLYNGGGSLFRGDPGTLAGAFIGGFIGVVLAIPIVLAVIVPAALAAGFGALYGCFRKLLRN